MIIRNRIQFEIWNKISQQLFLVAILLVALLSSCEQAPTPTPKPEKATPTPRPSRPTQAGITPRPLGIFTPTTAPTSSLKVDSNDLQGLEILFWHPWSGETGRIVEALVDEFNSSNIWGIEVVADSQTGFDALFENLSTTLETGARPDVIASYFYHGLYWNRTGDKLVELEPYVNDPVWGFSEEEQADFYTGMWEQERWDSGRFGLPAQRTAQLLYYNLTWAKELGFANAPTTASQFQRQACTAARANQSDTDRTNDGTGGLIISLDYDVILNWIYAFQGQVVNPEDGYAFDTSEIEAAFNFLRELYDQGCAWLTEQDFPEVEFATRQGLFSTGSSAGIPSQEAAFADLGSKDEWTVIPFPAGRGEADFVTYGPSFMVFQSEPDKQLASWLLIKWLTSPASQARLAEASAHFPVRASSLDTLDLLPRTHPQWSVAASFLPSARPEPPLESWRIVRWAVSDAATQLFRYYFEVDQVPQLIKLLDQTANDLNDSSQ